MVTIYDIALKCGVSPSTVSKVINDYEAIPQETKDKVRRVMKEMDYIPNVSAKSLSKGSSRNVGILAFLGVGISPFKHNLFIDVLDSFQSEMNANNYDLLFVSRNVAGQNGSFYQNCISRDVAGVLLFGDLTCAEMQEVIHSSIPKVGFDYMGDQMTGVFSDNLEQMRLLTNHLIKLGHRNIVFVHGEYSDVTNLRVAGFKKALAENGIEFKDSMLEESKYLDKDSVWNVTSNVLHRLNVPTAIMFPDDISAIQGLGAIREAGLSCPRDVSITGFDGIQLSQVVSPHLTTIKQDSETIGKVLAQKLIQGMKDKKTAPELLEVRASLIVGESTSEPRH
jgi:LacI family transcriptional regulator